MDSPVLGILGGVGPLATAYFISSIVEKTPVSCDQDHMPMIVFNDPQIPDRTAHILDASKPDPTPEMASIARRLEEAGASYIAIPCNTAHAYYDAVNAACSIPVLNIMDETVARIRETLPAGGRVGLLATEGTIASGAFQRYFEAAGLELVPPGEELQGRVTELIYQRVKAGGSWRAGELLDLARELMESGCDAVCVGCTELSVMYCKLDERPSWLFDSLDILAATCVERYLEERREKA